MRILIIEDDREAASYLVKAFMESGHVADRMLPTLDGLTLIGRLRQAGVDTPVLILSALGEVDDRIKGLRAGGDDYLTKPYAYSELLARVEALARRAVPEEQETRYAVADLVLDR